MTLEERVTALEKENAELKRQLEERHKKFISEDSDGNKYDDNEPCIAFCSSQKD